MTAYISLLVLVVCLVLFFVVPNAKVEKLSYAGFFAGLFVFLFGFAGQTVNLFGK